MGLVAETKFWSLRLDFVAKMASSHDATGPCDLLQGLVASSHDATSPCDMLQGLVAGTSPIVCADLRTVGTAILTRNFQYFCLYFQHYCTY